MKGMKFKIEKVFEITKEDKEYPEKLRQVDSPPQKLYVLGNTELLKNKAIAIVGTRKNTEYGERYTKKFASQLSNCGITIISGLALGIDTIAHQNSMKGLGRTIAVIGSGFEHIYPNENKNLFNQILQNDGCIISEYSPDTPVNMLNFPLRNRIIAGLSLGVLVTEARFRSGSSITARDAFAQKKPVFCLPNKLGETTGVGPNNLIKIGAHLVTNVNDILSEIGEKLILPEKLNAEQKELIKRKDFNISKIEKQYRSIFKALQEEPININELARKTQKSIIEINQKITIMEIEGLIEVLPGNIIKIKE